MRFSTHIEHALRWDIYQQCPAGLTDNCLQGLRSSTHVQGLSHVLYNTMAVVFCPQTACNDLCAPCWCTELPLVMQLWVDPSPVDPLVPTTGLVAPTADLLAPTTGLAAPTAAHQVPTADHQEPMTGLAGPMVPHQAPAHLVPTAAHQEPTPTPDPVDPMAAPPVQTPAHLQATAVHLQATADLPECRTMLPGALAPLPAPALPPRPRTVRERRLHLYHVLASYKLALTASLRSSVPHI